MFLTEISDDNENCEQKEESVFCAFPFFFMLGKIIRN